MRIRSVTTSALILLAVAGAACQAPDDAVDVDFVVDDERFHDFIPTGSTLEILADDFGWAEGPVWAPSLDALLFSDVSADKIYRWDASNGLSVYLSPSGPSPDNKPQSWQGSNGLAIDAQDRLLLAQQGRRTLARMRAPLSDPVPDHEVLATEFAGAAINSPNDLVVHRSGDIYFTDPPYGLSGFENSPDIQLEFFGVFRLSASGQLSVVTDELKKPNGIALSPDQSIIYVSNSEPGNERIIAIQLDEEGDGGPSRVFFDASKLGEDAAGSTDGMAVHPSGFLFASIPGGVGILSPAGELMGMIPLGAVTNMALDSSSSYLYITTPKQLLRINILDASP